MNGEKPTSEVSLGNTKGAKTLFGLSCVSVSYGQFSNIILEFPSAFNLHLLLLLLSLIELLAHFAFLKLLKPRHLNLIVLGAGTHT